MLSTCATQNALIPWYKNSGQVTWEKPNILTMCIPPCPCPCPLIYMSAESILMKRHTLTPLPPHDLALPSDFTSFHHRSSPTSKTLKEKRNEGDKAKEIKFH